MATTTEFIDLDDATFSKGLARVYQMFSNAPVIIGFYLHDKFFYVLFSTRRETFARTTGKLKGRGTKGRGWLSFAVFPFPGKGTNQLRTAFRAMLGSKSTAQIESAMRSPTFSDKPIATLDSLAIGGNMRDRAEPVVVQEEGAVIHASGARYMAIPIKSGISKAKEKGYRPRVGPRGGEKATARDFRQQGLKMFVRASRSGRLKLAADLGETSRAGRPKATNLFSLRARVSIPPRLGVYRTWNSLAGWREGQWKDLEAKIVRHLNEKGGTL